MPYRMQHSISADVSLRFQKLRSRHGKMLKQQSEVLKGNDMPAQAVILHLFCTLLILLL